MRVLAVVCFAVVSTIVRISRWSIVDKVLAVSERICILVLA